MVRGEEELVVFNVARKCRRERINKRSEKIRYATTCFGFFYFHRWCHKNITTIKMMMVKDGRKK